MKPMQQPILERCSARLVREGHCDAQRERPKQQLGVGASGLDNVSTRRVSAGDSAADSSLLLRSGEFHVQLKLQSEALRQPKPVSTMTE
jgi:hypothetical protein